MSDGAQDWVDRESARVLLLDARDRVLLFLGHDPVEPGNGTWWFTPGGGVDPGEDLRDTAVRELREETGLQVDPATLLGPVHDELAYFSLEGVAYRQRGTFYVARLPEPDVVIDTAGFSALESAFVLDHRWWTADELRTTRDVVHPAVILELLLPHLHRDLA